MSRSIPPERYGPWALVTGAAEGLGAEFARQVAASGLDVVLVDVQEEKLEQRASELSDSYGVAARPVACDLAEPAFLERIRDQTAGLEIGLLVCCAAHGSIGELLRTPLEAMRRAIRVNCLATLDLVYGFAPPMVERSRGGIVIVASNSAYTGSPYVANYAATKAYDLSLGEALWYELEPHGVDVLAFSPQGTNTPGFRRGMPDLAEGEEREGVMLPEHAVELALGALGRLCSLRPDRPEDWSRARERAVRESGEVLRGFAVHRGDD